MDLHAWAEAETPHACPNFQHQSQWTLGAQLWERQPRAPLGLQACEVGPETRWQPKYPERGQGGGERGKGKMKAYAALAQRGQQFSQTGLTGSYFILSPLPVHVAAHPHQHSPMCLLTLCFFRSERSFGRGIIGFVGEEWDYGRWFP